MPFSLSRPAASSQAAELEDRAEQAGQLLSRLFSLCSALIPSGDVVALHETLLELHDSLLLLPCVPADLQARLVASAAFRSG